MKAWKIWFWVILGILIMGTVAIFLALWSNVGQEWRVEQSAASYALHHSPLRKITGHDVFTGAQAQEVFFGTDAQGRAWIAFVYGSPFQVNYVPNKGFLNKGQVVTEAVKQHVDVLSVHLGYLTQTVRSTLPGESHVVWEVDGVKKDGHTSVHVFYDAQSGSIIKTY